MDNLINSITSTSDSGITLTLPMAIVAMAAALIFGLVISLTHIWVHIKINISRVLRLRLQCCR